MTYKKLKKVALTHFALHGYEGVSLSLIANEAGIKKPSIYTHFKVKRIFLFVPLKMLWNLKYYL
ncbi:TetR/AcrR family transcriptional regulator [Cytobacillus kochii]|uniref:TetR/AcrR family transcriptional regulator n=1 Tax=Cytobacillus TaxID=2675230 RepID=UPI00278AB93B|nr:AcrR family transcriptional regulator [Cytobacillus kochii]